MPSHYLLKLVCDDVSRLFLQNLWDLTPDTDLLKELPENYSFETALADLIVSVPVKLPEKIECLMENLCLFEAALADSHGCICLFYF